VHAPYTKKGKAARAAQISLLLRPALGSLAPTEAAVHPASVNSALNGEEWHSPYAAYHDCCFTTRRYVRGCSPVPPLAPHIFCGGDVRIEEPPLVRVDGRLVRDGGEGTVVAVLDGWLRLRIPSEAAPLVLQLRARVDELFVGIVERPGSRGDPDSLSALIGAVVALFEDAIVEPLPLPEKPGQPNANTGSSKTKTRNRRKRERKKRATARKAVADA